MTRREVEMFIHGLQVLLRRFRPQIAQPHSLGMIRFVIWEVEASFPLGAVLRNCVTIAAITWIYSRHIGEVVGTGTVPLRSPVRFARYSSN